MDKQQVKELIDRCHAEGRRVAVSFCSHVPQEILEAAGFCAVRLSHIEGVADISGTALPNNLCPLVKEVYSLCEGDTLADADLIIAESSCDGKKKMYELLTRQEQLYYYQIPQGSDREYVRPLIRSECSWLVKMLKQRFGAELSEQALRDASEQYNRLRKSVMDLMALQQQIPPVALGSEILQILDHNRLIANPVQQAEANETMRSQLLSRTSPVPKSASRILLTGCPVSGVYRKILGAIEDNGGVVVCMENCEVIKSNRRYINTAAENIWEAIADCYQDTACAIMAPNDLRFDVLVQLIADYKVDGIIDLALQTCHAYTVERDKMRRFCAQKGIPYLPVETSFSNADLGQITTRVSAFIEML